MGIPPSPDSESKFFRIQEADWHLSDQVYLERRKRLVHGPTYEQIVASMAREAELVGHKRGQKPCNSGFFRVLITLKMKPEIVDLFHNSAAGYRAQFFHSVQNGDGANTYAIKILLPQLKKLLEVNPMRTCQWNWVKKSLLDSQAKLWIHQGPWLRHNRKKDWLLLVQRWMEAQQSSSNDNEEKKKARWASLVPHLETRVDIKGGCLSLSGEPMGEQLKPNRGKDIHELGFT